MFKKSRKWIAMVTLVVVISSCFLAEYFRSGILIGRIDKCIVYLNTDRSLVTLIKNVEPSVVYVEAIDEYGYRKWSGSGVIISPDGMILTAGHVVRDVTKFKVILADGREFISEDSYGSYKADAGFIRIDPNGVSLPFSDVGDSDELQKGQEIFIIGCPYGYDLFNSISSGIISGLERRMGYFGDKLLVQSDAQAWPGVSGGPVFNMYGQVIGILIGGRAGPGSGISFVTPSNMCALVLDIYEAEQELENAS